MNWRRILNCINLLEYFLLVSPPLNRVPIPKINTTPTDIKSTINNFIACCWYSSYSWYWDFI